MRIATLLAVVLGCAVPTAALATVASDIPCQPSSPPPGPCILSSAVNVTVDPTTLRATLDFGGRGLVLTGAGELDAGGGTMAILAGSLVLHPGALLTSAGGEIDITTTGNVDVQAASNKAKIDVSGQSGGTIMVDAGGDVTIAGQLNSTATTTAGDGGEIDVSGASVTLAASGRLNAMAGATGTGGDVSVSASPNGVLITGTIDVSGTDAGTISLDGDEAITTGGNSVMNGKAGQGGGGAEIDIETFVGGVSLDGVMDISAGGSLDLGGGTGGILCVDSATTITSVAKIDAHANGMTAFGGDVEFDTDADGDVSIGGSIDASAPGTGGADAYVSISTDAGTIMVDADVDASGPGGSGEIDVSGFGPVRLVGGTLVADGPKSLVYLAGCDVSVGAGVSVSSMESGGKNWVQASGQMTIAGRLVAGQTNLLEYLDPAKPPIVSFQPVPAPTVAQNPFLVPCGGPTTTTTTSTTTTTTTTIAGGSTTTTTTVAATTSTTIIGATTSTTTLGATTSTTAAPTTTSSTTHASSTTTTVASTTTTTAPSTTSSTVTTTTTITTTTATTSTTTTSPTASSTTTTSVTSSSTTTGASSTSTTLGAAAACVAAGCDDGDDCTDDACDPVAGCVHTSRPGLDLVSCRLDDLATALAASPVTDLGGTAARARYSSKIGKARRMVDAARKVQGRRQITKLRRAGHVIDVFTQSVRNGLARRKVQTDVAARLLELAGRAASSVLALTQ